MNGLADLRVVVMGVSGSGKTTLGRALAGAHLLDFLDGDDFHPESNRMKMASGRSLSDADRLDWLTALHAALLARPRVVIACSALKVLYRERLAEGVPDARS